MDDIQRNGSDIRLLVAEDDAVVAQDLKQTLTHLGYNVVGIATSGREALEKARDRRPDLALMDIRMPGEMDGVDTACAIEDEIGTPVVYLTAFADRDTLRRVTRSKPYGYVLKPFSARELEASIELALQRKRTENAQKERERWFETIIERVRDIIMAVDETGVVEYMSPAVEDVLGWSTADRVGKEILELVHEEDRQAFRQHLVDALREPARSVEAEVRVRTSAGNWRQLHIVGRAYPSGSSPRLVLNARDVTERRKEQRRLRANEERYRVLFQEGIAGAFQATLDGTVLEANRALVAMLGYSDVEDVTGRPADRFFDAEDWRGIVTSLRESEVAVSQEVGAAAPGAGDSCFLLSCGLSRVPERQEPVIIGTAVDITERKRLERDLEWMAYHDALTGLLNRRALMEQASRYFELAERREDQMAVAYIDLTDFKAINDRFGHDAGDAVLSEVAGRLEGEARGSDLVARVGGDEFVVLMTDVGHAEAARTAAERFAAGLGGTVEHGSHSIPVGGDVGVATFPGDGSSIEELLAAADEAMYELKRNGGGDVVLRGDADAAEPDGRGDLKRALEEGEFFVEYQPIVSADDDSVAAVEAFLRWRRPGDRDVTASEFLPDVERFDLSSRVDDHMLGLVARDLSSAALPETTQWISVNLTPSSLSEARVLGRLGRLAEGVRGRGLELVVEISAPRGEDGVKGIGRQLTALRGENVSVALDHGGDGASPLTSVSVLPVELVKVPGTGPAALRAARDPHQAMKGFIQLVHALGARVVIECIEAPDDRGRARNDGADYLQGYAVGRPGSLDALSGAPTRVG